MAHEHLIVSHFLHCHTFIDISENLQIQSELGIATGCEPARWHIHYDHDLEAKCMYV